MKKISVVLATYNEESNLQTCLDSVVDLADEIVIVDGGSTDKTVEIAKSYKAKIINTSNPKIFHINKQKALEAASSEWILQLDADEIVTKNLRQEISQVIEMTDDEIKHHQELLKNKQLFIKHQKLLEARDGNIGSDTSRYEAFFIPRLNYFLGKYLKYGGVYPDGVIRLLKKGKAYFPCKDVHEQIIVAGKVGWLNSELIHMSDPTFARYLERNSRYIDLITIEMKKERIKKNIIQYINYLLIKPTSWFISTYFLHRGFLDGFQGFIFSFFSALRFPRAFFRYLKFS